MYIATDKTFSDELFYHTNRCRFEQAILEQWVSTVLVKATAKMTHLLAVVGLRMTFCLRIKPYHENCSTTKAFTLSLNFPALISDIDLVVN